MILMKRKKRFLFSWITAGILLGAAGPSYSQLTTKLRSETVQGFDHYVKMVEESLENRWNGTQSFLWVYENSQNRTRALRGEVVVESMSRDKGIDIPGGIVHDWIGATYVPRVRAETVLKVMQDYNRHKQIYPEVIDSRLIRHEGETWRSFLRLRKKKILTVVLNSEHEARYYHPDPNRWYCRSYSLRIAEVSNPGTPSERERPVGEDHGFLWRLYAYWHLDQVQEGVFVECRVLSLTRDVPTGLGWIINPIIRDLPGESLKQTLEFTRKAVLSSIVSNNEFGRR
jgi:hypothetical protein